MSGIDKLNQSGFVNQSTTKQEGAKVSDSKSGSVFRTGYHVIVSEQSTIDEVIQKLVAGLLDGSIAQEEFQNELKKLNISGKDVIAILQGGNKKSDGIHEERLPFHFGDDIRF